MKIKKLKIVFLFSIVGLFSFAQETTLPQEKQETIKHEYDKDNIRFFGVSLSYYDIDFGHVNSFLENSGMPTVQDGLRSMLTLYYRSNFIFKKLYFDGSLAGRVSGTIRNDNYALKQQIILFDVGLNYLVLDKTDHNLSLGAFSGTLVYRADIDNVLPNQQSDRLQKNSEYLGIRASYILYEWIHITAGYRFDIDSKRVKVNGHKISNSPELSSDGLFFGVGIGF